MLRDEQIYEAVFDEQALRGLPSLLAHELNARSCLIQWVHSDGQLEGLADSFPAPELMDIYASTSGDKDWWLDTTLDSQRQKTVYNIYEVTLPERWNRSKTVEETCRIQGNDRLYCMGAAYKTGWGIGVIGVHRVGGVMPFSEDSVKMLDRHSLALRRVLMVRGELAARRRDAELARDALDKVGLAAIVVDRHRRILHVNEVAEAVLRRGESLISRRGHLTVQDAAGMREFEAVIGLSASRLLPRSAALTVPRSQSPDESLREPYRIAVTPMPTAGPPGRALIVFRDPDMQEPSLGVRLQSIFRLTPAEAELAVCLGAGDSLADIARARRVRENTVRSQVKSLAAKLGCHRQAEIAAIIARVPPINTLGWC